MIKKILLLSILIFHCYGIEVSLDNSLALETFFRISLEKSEGGYVLYGCKPVCTQGFNVEDIFLDENEKHLTTVFLRKGASIWKNLNLPSSNIIIHVYNNEDTLVKNCIHVLFINKKLFLDVVGENLSLFQYVLGPDVTPERLLNKLTEPNASFHAVLKADKVLIGILLGFGTQNSLYESRIENIDDSHFASEQPPFKNPLAGEIRPELLEILLMKDSFSKREIPQPSFGYSSLKEELTSLFKKMDVSSLKLARNSPPFIFGRLKENKETDELVSELEKTQVKINQLLASNDFLNDVLRIIYPNESITISSRKTFFPVENLPNLVASNILRVLKYEDESYRQSFLKGMEDAEQGLEFKAIVDSFKYDKLKAFSEIQNNLNTADNFFQNLDSTYVCVSPRKLYYKIVQNGVGESINNHTNVSVYYTLKTPDDMIVASNSSQLNLSDTIPGFAWGIKGMKVGEIREIYIHPCFGYGIYTTFEKGVFLKAIVQLLDIDKNEGIFPELVPLDLRVDFSLSDYIEEGKKVGYANGYNVWMHYKKCNLYSFSQVLEKLKNGEEADLSNQENQDIINRLHWIIYNNSTS